MRGRKVFRVEKSIGGEITRESAQLVLSEKLEPRPGPGGGRPELGSELERAAPVWPEWPNPAGWRETSYPVGYWGPQYKFRKVTFSCNVSYLNVNASFYQDRKFIHFYSGIFIAGLKSGSKTQATDPRSANCEYWPISGQLWAHVTNHSRDWVRVTLPWWQGRCLCAGWSRAGAGCGLANAAMLSVAIFLRVWNSPCRCDSTPGCLVTLTLMIQG